jgi:uncharacterized protein
MDRRSFLKSTAGAAAAVPFTALNVRAQEAQPGVRRGQTAGYGPLLETPDQTTGLPLLTLPQGFKYVSMGTTRASTLSRRAAAAVDAARYGSTIPRRNGSACCSSRRERTS